MVLYVRINEQYHPPARALYILVHFVAFFPRKQQHEKTVFTALSSHNRDQNSFRSFQDIVYSSDENT